MMSRGKWSDTSLEWSGIKVLTYTIPLIYEDTDRYNISNIYKYLDPIHDKGIVEICKVISADYNTIIVIRFNNILNKINFIKENTNLYEGYNIVRLNKKPCNFKETVFEGKELYKKGKELVLYSSLPSSSFGLDGIHYYKFKKDDPDLILMMLKYNDLEIIV